MSKESIRGLPNYHGIYFDPATGKTYREDGTDTGFTFEHPTWTGPFGLHFQWPWLNPLTFASYETAIKVLHFVRGLLPKVSVSLDEENRISGPFTRTVERLIVVSDGHTEESFNAGLLANSIIRVGEKLAAQSFLAEVKHARIVEDPELLKDRS